MQTSHPCKPFNPCKPFIHSLIHANHSLMQTAHPWKPFIHANHSFVPTSHSCKPFIHANHSVVQTIHPCKPLNPCKSFIHANHSFMQTIHPCKPLNPCRIELIRSFERCQIFRPYTSLLIWHEYCFISQANAGNLVNFSIVEVDSIWPLFCLLLAAGLSLLVECGCHGSGFHRRA